MSMLKNVAPYASTLLLLPGAMPWRHERHDDPLTLPNGQMWGTAPMVIIDVRSAFA